MLGNRLANLCAWVILFTSCAHQQIDSVKSNSTRKNCQDDKWQTRHVKMATRAQGNRFASCLVNYMRLRNLSELNLNVCVKAQITGQGKVAGISLSSMNDSDIEQELRWCVEQELWKLDYAALQLEFGDVFHFPLDFKVRF